MNSIDVAIMCKALGDSNRLQIIKILSACDEKSACDLLEHFQITQPTLSHHMKVLSECALVDIRKEGKWHYYSVNKERLKEFIKYIRALCHGKCQEEI